MVDNNINAKLINIQSGIDKLTKNDNNRKEQVAIKNDVVLFFSFDIVNSTSYKTINYFGWAQALNVLFREIRNEVQIKIPDSEMWRVLGDEAIFIKKITDNNSLYEYIDKIYSILIETIFKLKKGDFFIQYDKELMKLQNNLSLKATAWIADVRDVGNIENKEILQNEIENIFEKYESQEGNEIFEFLGNDIDAGFRISKQTEDGRLVLSFELAYLISQRTESLSYLKIITYKRLKGVWKDKLYPIIWYHNPNTYLKTYQKKIELEESFCFDAEEESELIKEYYENRAEQGKNRVVRDIKMFTDCYYALNKIAQDRGLGEKLNNLNKCIQEAVKDQERYIGVEKLELHCVAVCFKRGKDGIKILVAKRTDSREKFKEQWEFGCAKAVMNKSLVEKIKEEYKNDFNIEIEPVIDENREQKEPVPIALYNVNRMGDVASCKSDKGVITMAEIIGDFNVDTFKPTEKHDKLAWIKKEDIDEIDIKYSNHVPDFKETIISVFERVELNGK
ncbi:MAG: hypothetical protein Q4B86_07280 [Eubacteriales bacterium]|nr:hypothetical protein [Eubacteriales bacterium]